MTHKIAIITTDDYSHGYGDDGYETIIRSITDWVEVTDHEYKALQMASHRLGFKILQQPTDMKEFVAKTVADYLAYSKAEEARVEKERAAREKIALEKKMKKELKTVESKRALLKKLQEELGDEAS